jgi:enamine deaminase RidA (YjgF/YER057c/UK114 family)
MTPEDRLLELGLTLPVIDAPSGSYSHAIRDGDLLYLAGKGLANVTGKVGRDFNVQDAYAISASVGLQLLAVIRQEIGTLNAVDHFIKVLGFVNAVEDFQDHPSVINGCSDLFISVFGDRGRHARSAIGVASLPFGIPIEIEALIRIRTD